MIKIKYTLLVPVRLSKYYPNKFYLPFPISQPYLVFLEVDYFSIYFKIDYACCSPNVASQDGINRLINIVPSVQVTMSLPLFRNSSSHDTVSSVPVFTGNVVSVLRLSQAGSRPVHLIRSE